MNKIHYLLLLLSFNCLSQTINLSRYEKCWAIFHPIAALKLKRIDTRVSPIFKATNIRVELDNFTNGGRADAFRHVFYMAAFAQKIKVKKLRKLGRAHEKANYQSFKKARYEDGESADSLSSEMDLINNELGFKLGSTNKKLTAEELRNLVIREIRSGKAVIMKRDSKGNYEDCSDRRIDLSLYSGRWNVPKCLVASDYSYSD